MRKYVTDDFKQIKSWFWERGMFVPDFSDIPTNGVIEDDLACGFLLYTDTSTAIIDFLITNPRAPMMARGKATQRVIKHLILMAKEQGFDRIKCDTKLRGVVSLARRLNFKELGQYHSFSKEI